MSALSVCTVSMLSAVYCIYVQINSFSKLRAVSQFWRKALEHILLMQILLI